jgi:hypothetical protein
MAARKAPKRTVDYLASPALIGVDATLAKPFSSTQFRQPGAHPILE